MIFKTTVSDLISALDSELIGINVKSEFDRNMLISLMLSNVLINANLSLISRS